MVPLQGDAEDEKSDQEEEKKTEEKKLYEIDHVYRTEQMRLGQLPIRFLVNSFGFTDKTGEGESISIQAVHDKELQSGTNTIMADNGTIKVFKKNLAILET